MLDGSFRRPIIRGLSTAEYESPEASPHQTAGDDERKGLTSATQLLEWPTLKRRRQALQEERKALQSRKGSSLKVWNQAAYVGACVNC